MFEDRTYENIMRECLAAAPGEVDIRPGGIIYDSVVSCCFKIAQFYADLRTAFNLVHFTTAVDEYLDDCGMEFRVLRNPATRARYSYTWVGTGSRPSVGERFFSNGLYFVLRYGDTVGELWLEAEQSGSVYNNILPGSPAVPVNNIGGLTVSAFGELIEPGVDKEGDESYRRRIQEQLAGPAENGNRQHYKSWCESVPGVGRARIIPCFAGENTVMGVIIGADGLPAAESVIERVQEYIDPITMDLKFTTPDGEVVAAGDGLGDGVANIGAHFAAVPPEPLMVNVGVAVAVSPGISPGQIEADAGMAITEFLKGLAMTTPEQTDVIIRVSAVNAIIYSLPDVLDYNTLTLNGAADNITVSERQLAVLGEVKVRAIV